MLVRRWWSRAPTTATTDFILSRGLRVPDDIALVGFDDIEDGRYSTPSLTTISPDKTQIAKNAVQLLLNRLDGDRSAPAELSADYTLQIRESTAGQNADAVE